MSVFDGIKGSPGREIEQSPGMERVLRIPVATVDARVKRISKSGPYFSCFTVGTGTDEQKKLQMRRRFAKRTAAVTSTNCVGSTTDGGVLVYSWDTPGYTGTTFIEEVDPDSNVPTTSEMEFLCNFATATTDGSGRVMSVSVAPGHVDPYSYGDFTAAHGGVGTVVSTSITTTDVTRSEEKVIYQNSGTSVVTEYGFTASVSETLSEEWNFGTEWAYITARLSAASWPSSWSTTISGQTTTVLYDQHLTSWDLNLDDTLTRYTTDLASPPTNTGAESATSAADFFGIKSFTPGNQSVFSFASELFEGSMSTRVGQFRARNGAVYYSIYERVWVEALNKFVCWVIENLQIISDGDILETPAPSHLSFGMSGVTVGGVEYEIANVKSEIVVIIGNSLAQNAARDYITANSTTHVLHDE